MPQASREIALSSNVLLEYRSSAVAKRSTKSVGESEAAKLRFENWPISLIPTTKLGYYF